VGSLLSLDPELHVYFARLADRYGPIFSIRLGSKLVVVVTSASLAREVLREQDLARMQEGKSLRDGGELVTGNAADPLVDRQRGTAASTSIVAKAESKGYHAVRDFVFA
jgi:cytochrome P450